MLKITKGTTLNLILTVALFVFGLLYFKSCGDHAEIVDLNNAAQSELKTTRNKLDQEVAEIQVMIGSRKSDLLEMYAQTEEIKRLQELVKKTEGKLMSASVLLNETRDSLVGATEVIDQLTDTLWVNDSTMALYPVYQYKDTTDWACFDIKMSKDSTWLNYSIKNRYLMSQSIQRKGFLGMGKRSVIATITNENPNTFTKEYKTFTIKCDCDKGKWFGFGAGAGVLGSILLNRGLQ